MLHANNSTRNDYFDYYSGSYIYACSIIDIYIQYFATTTDPVHAAYTHDVYDDTRMMRTRIYTCTCALINCCA